MDDKTYIVLFLVAFAIIPRECHGGGPYANIKDLSNIRVTPGGSAVFKFTEQRGFKLTWCMFGLAKAGVISPSPDILRVEFNDTSKETSTKKGSHVDDRVSFIGNMSKGQAWFKIDNVKPADTKTYKVRCNVVVGRLSREQRTATAVLDVPNVITTTAAPTTVAPTTVAPTTAAPTTVASAAVIENDGLSVTCNSDYMEAKLDISKHTGLRIDTVALEDRNCKVTRSESNFVYFRTKLDGCGTKHNMTDDSIIYYNSIYADTGSGSNNAKISRALQAEFPFKCSYPRKALLSVTSFSPRRKVVYTRTSEYGNFTYTMNLYKTDKYKQMYDSYPIKTNLNEKLFVQTAVVSNDSKLALFNAECWATPSADSEDSTAHEIITKGCSKDKTLEYDFRINNPFQQFNIRAFRFISARSNDVYMHCKVEVCRDGDDGSNCAKGCRGGSRKRRSVLSPSEVLTLGPIKIKRDGDTQSAVSHSSSLPIISTIAGVLGVVVVGLAVAVGIVAMKRRRGLAQSVILEEVAEHDGDLLTDGLL